MSSDTDLCPPLPGMSSQAGSQVKTEETPEMFTWLH